jgi:hypothetical protein
MFENVLFVKTTRPVYKLHTPVFQQQQPSVAIHLQFQEGADRNTCLAKIPVLFL